MSDILQRVYKSIGQKQKASTEYVSSRKIYKKYAFPVLNIAKREAKKK